MENRTTRFLMSSMVLITIFCIVVFSVQAIWNSTMGAKAITDIGIVYMSGVSEQVAAHFGTTIGMRLSQVAELADAVSPERMPDLAALRVSLSYIAQARGFEYLALYTEDGQLEMIYGPQLRLEQLSDAFQAALRRHEERVGGGLDVNGTEVVLMSVPASYTTSGGGRSLALVAGLSTQSIHTSLTVNIDRSMADYSIIRQDGSFIIRGNGMEDEENYFDRISSLYHPVDGRSAEQFAADLKQAMAEREACTGQVQMDGDRWHLYCSALPSSNWYLLFYMPYSTLDQTVASLGRRWTLVCMGGCALILALLLLVFYQYFRMTRRQVRDLDEARRSAERASQVKSEFLSNMSHDIRTPMNGIMGMTSVAIANLDNTAQVHSCLKKINISSRHLLGLLNDMLDMSKIERGELGINMAPLSLRDMIYHLLPMVQPQMQEKKQRFLVYTKNIRYENVLGDTVRLTQILLNLLGNAGKFTPEGGEIQLLLYQEPSPKGDSYIRTHLRVEDNGIGMEQEFQEKIFDAFVREDRARVQKAAGSGLGLTITKHIIDAMNGGIEVSSAPGQGSTFHVILDLEKVHVQELDQHLPERNVLVVDSDSQSREAAIEMLSSIGLHAEGAASAAQGAEMGIACRERGEGCHLALLDWNLPEEENIQAAELLQKELHIPVLALYDGDWGEAEESARAAGVAECITKPLFRSGLYYGLRKFIQAAPAPEPEEPVEEAVDLTGKRVLLAEDNELNYEIASELLQELGMEVDWAENGQICVEKFVQSAPDWYDIVLMDLRMPLMTGFEAARTIRALPRDDAGKIPIIAVSADTFYDDIQRCLESGMDAHTPKPIDMGEVSRLMEKYIRQ